MRTVNFGIIGGGLMGREFASAVMRWGHLHNPAAVPRIVSVCSRTAGSCQWFVENLSSLRQTTTDYRAVLANADVEAVYVAVPHHLHEEIYCAAIEAGKHLLGEKPFGIDRASNRAINAALDRRPDCFARCSSEFPFHPGVQRIGRMIEAGSFGRIVEVNAGFLHSSDLDPHKPINWKRQNAFNGSYGCLGDLGLHVCHVPFRAGWIPRNVRAILSKLIDERPGPNGGMVPCETWDNATLLGEVADAEGRTFPLTIKTQRIAPGEKNSWFLEILGLRGCARWNSKRANRFDFLDYRGGEQAWQSVDLGHEVTFPVITGGIFEAGFTDVILQMWAAFLHELVNGAPPSRFAGCATPREAALSHALFTAALESQRTGQTMAVRPDAC